MIAVNGLRYLDIPKAACSSIKAAIAATLGIPWRTMVDLHDNIAWPRSDRGPVFAVRRDDHDRLASFWRDKVVGKDTLWRDGHPAFGICGIRRGMSLEETRARIAAVPPQFRERHYAPTEELVRRAGVEVDYWLDFADLDAQWLTFARAHGLCEHLLHLRKTKP